jgi:hypothetical protein
MINKVKKILYCEKLKHFKISIMCTSNANYDLNFDELRCLEIISLKFYIKDFKGILMIQGSPGLRRSKVKILGSECKTFETSPDKHEGLIILNLLDCPKLKF